MSEGTSFDKVASQGTKRRADGTELPLEAPRRIKPLDPDVVNKIAAGEIIVAPVHALKELIENAVDAGATSLEILVKDGGLKLLQITDNGHGINKDDLPILCERFTTSKLKAFEDLTSIGTYGFRGEALASISHIAHLKVTTRTKDSSSAWQAYYSGGKLTPAKPGQSTDPKPCAGRQGTQITVEDLFYNVPTRRRAFRSASEEYAKILDMVGRYAVHCEGVAFSTKKHGESSVGISVQSTASTTDRIRQIHGSAVANEVIKFEATSDRWGFKSNGYITNANYSVKRSMLLLFINHRSVESSAIKKAVEQTYAAFLPKGGRPFVYLNLEIDPERVDVNVHPTKREVNFLNEDEIIEVICDEIRTTLAKVDTSRTFMTQTLLPGIRRSVVTGKSDGSPTVDKGDDSEDVQMTGTSTKKPTAQKPYENNLVRTDSRVRKITSMLPPGQPHKTAAAAELGSDELEYEENDREPVVCRLTSVKELRAEVRENMHAELTEVFAKHTFVGIVDSHRRSAAIQSGVKLYLIDYGMICNEYFYQLGLTDFGNFGSIRFSTPLRLHDLLSIAAAYEQEHTPADQRDAFDWDAAVQVVEQHIIERRDMLSEYFAFEVSAEGDLLAMPLLMKGYSPSMAKLPRFLLRLGPYVDWTDEKECFRTFLRELASLHVPESLPPLPPQRLQTDKDDGEGTGNDVAVAEEDAEQAARGKQLERVIENVIFPALKARLIATKGLLKSVVEVANLKGLYKVFERC